MQTNSKMPFVGLWKKLSSDEKQRIYRELIFQGYANYPQTVQNWGAGRTRPSTPAARRGIVKSINKVLGTNYDETIFTNE